MWNRWDKQAVWEDAGGGAPAVFTVSGTVTDWEGAGLSGVLLTLTGGYTATTDGSGAYTILNVPAGSYTLTPTKTGVVFDPVSSSVTVSTANVTGKNFAEKTYTISGDIVDGADAGIEGVTVTLTPLWAVAGVLLDDSSDPIVGATVTLSGDASDTDTTDANGAYSFLLPDGDYTITPTLTNYTFVETHEDVTVAGDDVVADDMVGTAYLSLPLDLNWNDGSALDTSVWTDGSAPGAATWLGNQAAPEHNSYTPRYTTCLKGTASGTGDTVFACINYDYFRDNGLVFDKAAGLRVQFENSIIEPLAYNRSHIMLYSTDDDIEISNMYLNWGTDWFIAREKRISTSYDAQTKVEPGVTSPSVARWTTLRLEINAGFSTITSYLTRDDGTFSSAVKSIVSDISAVNFDRIGVEMYRSGGSGAAHFDYVWIGTASDAWPT